MSNSIAFIGFGEAAQAFSTGLASETAPAICAFDIKTEGRDDIAQAKLADYAASDVFGCASLAEALAKSTAIFSVVTADQALAAAQKAAETITPNSFYFDCNSCAPTTKQKSAKLIQDAGAYYVDVAVMAPVHPALHKTPLLVSSPEHTQALGVLDALGMVTTHVPGDIGRASSIKMIRSIMVKGIEALTLECFLSAKLAGVAEEVFASLERTYPDFGWNKRVPYNLERCIVHGKRRAEEVREVAITVEALGLPNDMANSIVEWQQRIGDLGLVPAGDDADQLAGQILNKMPLLGGNDTGGRQD